MRGIWRTLALGVGLALAACSAAPPAAPPATPTASVTPSGPRAERPTYAVGERWSRNDGLFDLVRVEGDRYVFAAGTGREIHLTRDLGLAKVQRGENVLEFEPPPRLPWPLEVGKKETGQAIMRTPNHPQGRRVQFTWTVDGYEDVQVIAGTLKAFRLTLGIDRAQADRRWEIQTWYAPEARQFVKGSSTDVRVWNFQVLAVDRPAAAPLKVVLAEPKDQARLTTEGLVVSGKVSGDKGVTRVTVTLNGQEVSAQEERGAPKTEVALRIPLKLREGRNVLLVTATDATGATRQEARTVFYDRAPPAATTAAPTAPGASSTLQIALASPRDQARVEQETIGLAGIVSGDKGVSRVTVTLNGVEVSRQDEPTPQRSLALNLPLKLREGPNTLVVTAAEPAGTIHQEVRTVVYEKPVPLAIAVRYPEDRARLADEATVVAAIVTSSKGIAQVRVTLNGAQVHEQSERATQRSLALTVPVTLREGTNAIVISASEPDGTVRQEIRTVVLERPKVAALPPQPAPDRWAVVIGAGTYESAQIPRLRYSVRDAEVIAETLIGVGGFKKEHVLVLTDSAERKPSLKNIKWALGTFLARSAKKDDTVLIFFAGHGASEIDPSGLERDGFAKYLVPIDADPDDLYSTALPMDELQTVFSRIEAERVIAFLDTCYSGAAGGRTFASKKTRATNVDDLFLERVTRSKGRALVTAARPNEVSVELPELGHGLFTYYLIQALKGTADLDRDSVVTLQELYQYVEQEVSRKSRQVGANQHPVMKGELEGILPLVKVQRWEAPTGR